MKAKPTTIRLEPHLDRWVRKKASSDPRGISGIINAAVEEYMRRDEEWHRMMLSLILDKEGQDGGS